MINAELCRCRESWSPCCQHTQICSLWAAWLTISAEVQPGQVYRQQHVTVLKASHNFQGCR